MKSSFGKYWVFIAFAIIIFTFIFNLFSERLSSNIESKVETRSSIDKLKR